MFAYGLVRPFEAVGHRPLRTIRILETMHSGALVQFSLPGLPATFLLSLLFCLFFFLLVQVCD